MKKSILKFWVFTCIIFFSGTVRAQWALPIGGNSIDEVLSSCSDFHQHTIAGGYYSSSARFGTILLNCKGYTDAFITSTDQQGNVLWAVSGGGAFSDRITDVCCDSSGAIYACGSFTGAVQFGSFNLSTSDSSEEVFVLKISPSGQLLWAIQAGGNDNDLAYAISTSKNKVFVAGQFKGTSTFGTQTLTSRSDNMGIQHYDGFITCIDTAGQFNWVLQAGGSKDDRVIDIVSDSSGMSYICGQFSDTLYTSTTHPYVVNNACYLSKIDTAGNEVWFKPLFANQVLFRKLALHKNELLATGEVRGTPVYDQQTLPNQSNSSYTVFVLKTDCQTGAYHRSGFIHSLNDLSVRGITVANDTLFLTGTFSKRLTEFSDSLGTGVFNSVGFHDIYLTAFDTAMQVVYRQQFASPYEDAVSDLYFSDGTLKLCGRFLSNFNIPYRNNLIPSPALFDSSGFGPSQYPFACLGQFYSRYAGIYSHGTYDGFLLSYYDLLRPPYDYFDRTDPTCAKDTLLPYIYPEDDSIVSCDKVHLRLQLRTGHDGVIGPEYTYAWSNGATTDSTSINTSGWVHITCTSIDKWRTYTDSVYITILQQPPVPNILSTSGTVRAAIPINACLNKLLVNINQPGKLVNTNTPPGDILSWHTPAGATVNNDTVDIVQAGVYSAVCSTSNGVCSTGNCVEVYVYDTIHGYCIPSNAVPIMVFGDSLDHDTLSVCIHDPVTIGITDSTPWNQNFTFSDLPTFGSWTVTSELSFNPYASYPVTFVRHVQTFLADHSGMVTITVDLEDPFSGGVLNHVVDSFYLQVNPLPPIVSAWHGPTFLCPGDTVLLHVDPPGDYTLSGPNIPGGGITDDSVFAYAPGRYMMYVYLKDSITGCVNFDYIPYTLLSMPPPLIHMLPANGLICPGDSVYMVADSGSAYTWYGPSGAPLDTNQAQYALTPGNYYYTFIDTGGCALVSTPAEAISYSTPYLTADPAPILCAGGQLTLTVSTNPGSTINWLPPLSGTSLTQVVTQPGDYSCIVESCGITDTLVVHVTLSTVHAELASSLGDTICAGSSTTLSAPAGFAEYYWNDVPTGSSNQLVTDAGIYWVTVEDVYGCTATDTLVIDTFPLPQQPVTTGTTICFGDSATVQASSSYPVYWFLTAGGGQPADSGMVFHLDSITADTYVYAMTHDAHCYSLPAATQVHVNPVSLPQHIVGQTSFCYHDTISLHLLQTGGTQFNWTGPQGFQSTDSVAVVPAATPLNTGYYYFVVSDSQCTSPGDSIYVIVRDTMIPILTTYAPGVVCDGDSVRLMPTQTYVSYSWSPIISNQPILWVHSTGDYQLTVTDASGCKGQSVPKHIVFNPMPAPYSVVEMFNCVTTTPCNWRYHPLKVRVRIPGYSPITPL